MRTLLLFRHAKSDWHVPAASDHDRPLAPRGRKAAPQMGRFLSRAGYRPQRCLTSSAVRARETVALAAEAGGWDCPVEVSGLLYEASAERLVALLTEQPDTVDTLLLAGHEPVWSILAARLMGGGRLRLPTAAVACLRWPQESWREAVATTAELLWLVTPKLLHG